MKTDRPARGDERRRSKRFELPLEVEYRTLTQNPLYGSVMIRDISRGGLKIHGAKEFRRGLTVQLKMNVPGDNLPVFATGQVAWADGLAAGVRLTQISQKDLERILEYIYQRWLKNHSLGAAVR